MLRYQTFATVDLLCDFVNGGGCSVVGVVSITSTDGLLFTLFYRDV